MYLFINVIKGMGKFTGSTFTKRIPMFTSACWDHSNRRSYSLYEPDYLASMQPKYPQYDSLTVQLKGYDFAVLENYQKCAHNIAQYLDVKIDSCWAFPAQQLNVVRFKEQTSTPEAEYKLQLFERNIKILNVSSVSLSLLLELLEESLPPGVKLNVFPFDEEQDKKRYIPNLELRDLRAELEELGGPPEDFRE